MTKTKHGNTKRILNTAALGLLAASLGACGSELSEPTVAFEQACVQLSALSSSNYAKRRIDSVGNISRTTVKTYHSSGGATCPDAALLYTAVVTNLSESDGPLESERNTDGGAILKTNNTLISAVITLADTAAGAGAKATFNAGGGAYFGYTDWEIGVPKNVAGKSIPNNSYIANVGEVVHVIKRFEGNNMYLYDFEHQTLYSAITNNGKTESTRIVTLEKKNGALVPFVRVE